MDFTKEQQDFFNCQGNVVLSACPGSGKTFIVAQKLLNYLENWQLPHQGLAVLSFTNVASKEIENNIKKFTSENFSIQYPHFIGTIDSFLNQYIVLRFGYLIMKNHKRFKIHVTDYSKKDYRYKDCKIRRCDAKIHEFRTDLKGVFYKRNQPVECFPKKELCPCYKYKITLYKKGIIFQNDVGLIAYTILKKHPQIAKILASRFPIMLIDEAQDTSKEQMAVLDIINLAGMESMFLIGDIDQAIYEWRNATPECFRDKMNDKENWQTFFLTKNFRSSQLICNATHKYYEKALIEAKGDSKDFVQKPILCFFDSSIADYKEKLVRKFLNHCTDKNIVHSAENIAVVNRSSNKVEINELWKSAEIELLAEASYKRGKEKIVEAYDLCEKALFGLIIKSLDDIDVSLQDEVEKQMPYVIWKTMVACLLVKLPKESEKLKDWVKKTQVVIKEFLIENNVMLCNEKEIREIIRIKRSDTNTPTFKEMSIRQFFEVESFTNITYSTIHGVKGKTVDALLLIVDQEKGDGALTPKLVCEGDLDQELIRLAYVAMTRPRKFLFVAMRQIKKKPDLSRFPEDKWDYEQLEEDS